MKTNRINNFRFISATISEFLSSTKARWKHLQWGIAAIRLALIQIGGQMKSQEGQFHVSLVGPMTFLACAKIERLKAQIEDEPERSVAFDLGGVTFIDNSGANQFISVVAGLRKTGRKVTVSNASPNCLRMLKALQDARRPETFIHFEHKAQTPGKSKGPIHRLLQRMEQYRSRIQKGSRVFFSRLAENQKPHTLFFTCSDSGIDPNLITSTIPGELYVVRNIVPIFGSAEDKSEQAAIEYALCVLDVREIVVCGHSGCGAIPASLRGVPNELPGISGGLTSNFANDSFQTECLNNAARTTRQQVSNLLTYPIIRSKLDRGLLRIRACLYDIHGEELQVWSSDLLSPTDDQIGTYRQGKETLQ